jgi:hypothetical protein
MPSTYEYWPGPGASWCLPFITSIVFLEDVPKPVAFPSFVWSFEEDFFVIEDDS